MLTVVTGVKIDPEVTIQCPLIGFGLRRTSKSCPNCPGFHGIAQMSAQEDIPWEKKYVIRCSAVMERRTQRIVIQEA